MRVLAIDPGDIQSAYVTLDGGKIKASDIVKNELLFRQEAINLGEDPFDVIAIEMIASYGMPVGKTVFETCVWIGRFLEHFEALDCFHFTKHVLVYRKDVKMHFCHSMKAKDSNIRQALIDRLGEPGTKKNPGATYGISKDKWSALAIALYINDTLKGSNEQPPQNG